VGERRRRARCHTPEKDHYRYPAEAQAAAVAASAQYGHPMEAYECPTCEEWHITRVKPPRRPVYARG
jgi:hypothetical protein